MITLEQIKPYEAEVIETYKTLHRHPELGYEEVKTSALICEKLAGYGIDVTANLAVTGVMGVLDSGRPGKTVMLRADMDALPVIEDSGVDFSSEIHGKMHACGHDSHVAMLLGAAKYLSEHKDSFSGRVKFVFQPAEEGILPDKKGEIARLGFGVTDGAELMIAQGVMDGVDACYAIHIDTQIETGNFVVCKNEAMAAADHFLATIAGSGGHGSSPHSASDPVSALAAAIDAIQGIPSRNFSAMDRCVVNIGTIETPGSRHNIIPSRVEISGTVRTYDENVREKVFDLLGKKLSAAAELGGCTHRLTRIKGYDAVINDGEISRLAAESAAAVLGKDKVFYVDSPEMGSEDVGYFFKKAPGALCWLGGTSAENKKPAVLHSPYVSLDLNALKYGAMLHVAFVQLYCGDERK